MLSYHRQEWRHSCSSMPKIERLQSRPKPVAGLVFLKHMIMPGPHGQDSYVHLAESRPHVMAVSPKRIIIRVGENVVCDSSLSMTEECTFW